MTWKIKVLEVSLLKDFLYFLISNVFYEQRDRYRYKFVSLDFLEWCNHCPVTTSYLLFCYSQCREGSGSFHFMTVGCNLCKFYDLSKWSFFFKRKNMFHWNNCLFSGQSFWNSSSAIWFLLYLVVQTMLNCLHTMGLKLKEWFPSLSLKVSEEQKTFFWGQIPEEMWCRLHDTGLETGFPSETPVRILTAHLSGNWVFCGYLRNCLRGYMMFMQPDEYITLHRQLCNITSRIMKRVVTLNISK